MVVTDRFHCIISWPDAMIQYLKLLNCESCTNLDIPQCICNMDQLKHYLKCIHLFIVRDAVGVMVGWFWDTDELFLGTKGQ